MRDESDPVPDDAAVGRQVRQARTRLGLTQVQVAKLLPRFGIRWHSSAVAKIESGERPLRLSEAAALSAALGVSLPYLAGITNEVTQPVVDRRAERALQQVVEVALKALADPLRERQVERDALVAWLAALPAGANRQFLEAALRAADNDLAKEE